MIIFRDRVDRCTRDEAGKKARGIYVYVAQMMCAMDGHVELIIWWRRHAARLATSSSSSRDAHADIERAPAAHAQMPVTLKCLPHEKNPPGER